MVSCGIFRRVESLSDLINHTPTWVFIIFFTLLILGVVQSKNRSIKVKTVFILPVAMIVFSSFGVFSVFGITLLTMSHWCLGLILTSIIGIKLAYPKFVSFSEEDHKLTVPGSWTPLLFMMAIFFTKYFVGFAIARGLDIVNEYVFIASICLLYGIFSGVFLSRSLVIFKASKASV